MKAYDVSEVCAASRGERCWNPCRSPWTGRRRQELLELLERLDPSIAQLSQAIEQEAAEMAGGPTLAHSSGSGADNGVGVCVGHWHTASIWLWQAGGQLYLGLAPSEACSGDRQRLGHIRKAGNAMLRYFAGAGGTKCGWR
jgi:transposase